MTAKVIISDSSEYQAPLTIRGPPNCQGSSEFEGLRSIRAIGGQTCALADPAVGFGGGQLGEVTQARVPPKLKTPRIWPTIFWGVAQNQEKNKKIKKENKKVRLQVPGSSWKSMVSPVGP